MSTPQLILGVTRRQDDPKGPVTGLIVREGEKLRWVALDALPEGGRYFRLTLAGGVPAQQALERIEFTVGTVSDRAPVTKPAARAAKAARARSNGAEEVTGAQLEQRFTFD
ncbi:MAG: hypothetical protein ACK46X_18585, partial [Candidatus Sericytochromatia bacterium]